MQINEPSSVFKTFQEAQKGNCGSSKNFQSKLILDDYDQFIRPKRDSGNDGKFSIFTAAKEFLKGAIVRPIKAIIDHPILAIGAVAASVVAITAAPLLLPVMIVGGLAYGGYKSVQGIGDVISNIKNGDYDEAERSFGDIGEGVFAIATSATGLKAASSIVAEAKTASAIANATTAAKRAALLEKSIEAATKARSGTLLESGKELLSLFTSKAGRSALTQQLRPSNLFPAIKGQFTNFIKLFKTPPKINLKKTISAIQKDLKLADKDMPKIVSNSKNLGRADGLYKPTDHSIHIITDPFELAKHQIRANFAPQPFFGNDLSKSFMWLDKLPQPIKNFLANRALNKIDIKNILAHEMTHAKQSYAIKNLSKSQAKRILDDIPTPEISLKNGKKIKEILNNEFLKEAKLVPESSKATGKNYAHAKKALIDAYNTAIANNQTKSNSRAYIANSSEIEARLKGSQFSEKGAVNKFNKKLKLTPNIIKRVRDLKIEEKLNQLISKIDGLKHAPTPQLENIQLLENQLKALSKLVGHRSPTQIMLKNSYKQEKLIQITLKLKELTKEIKYLKNMNKHKFASYSSLAKNSAHQFYNTGKAQTKRFSQASKAAQEGFSTSWKKT